MRVTDLPIDVEGTIQFDMMLLKYGIPFTLSVTNEAGKAYFSGLSWIQIATELGMLAGKAFLLFLHEFEEAHGGNKIYLWQLYPTITIVRIV